MGDYFYGHDPGVTGHLLRFSLPNVELKLRLVEELGLLISDPVLEEDDLEADAYILKLGGVEVARGNVDMALAFPHPWRTLPKPFRAGESIAAHLFDVLCQHTTDIITLEYVSWLLQAREQATLGPEPFRAVQGFASQFPDLVSEVVVRHSQLTIRDVLRGLAAERQSLADLESIFKVLAECNGPIEHLLAACLAALQRRGT